MHILNLLLELLKLYWLDVVLVVAFLFVGILLLKRGKKDTVRRIVYTLVVQAEKAYGSKTGIIKRTEVISKLYGTLPWIVRFLFTQSDIENMIDESVKLLKQTLRTPGVNLLGYDEEQIINNYIEDKE